MFEKFCYPGSSTLKVRDGTAASSPEFRPHDHVIFPTRPVCLAQRRNDGEQFWRRSVQVAKEFLTGFIDAPPGFCVPGDGFARIGPVLERSGIEQQLYSSAQTC